MKLKKFYSKKDVWLGLIIWIPLLAALISLGYNAIVDSTFSIMFAVFLLINLFCAWLWFGTYYVFEEKYLLVKCGPFREKVYYDRIKEVQKTNNPLSAAACSLDRIKIKHGKYGSTLVSPKEKDEFIKEIQKRSNVVFREK